MAQFDVYRLPGGALAVDCQNDLLSILRTRLVVPLAPFEEAGNEVPRLHPEVEFEGRRWRFIADLATAVPARDLGKPQGSVASQEYPIKRALDLLISGI